MTTDSLIPHLLTYANEKEFKIKIDILKSVVGIGIKVSKQTFT
jgi:preprotein translocase subunit Sec61beta